MNFKRPNLIEGILIIGIIMMSIMGLVLFKMVEAGKITWDHIFWIIFLFG